MKAYVKKIICDTETPISIFLKIAVNRPYAFLFESAERNVSSGRYSFIGFDPLDLYVFPANGKQDPLEVLNKAYKKINYQSREDLPSFQAGFVGYFCYEIVRHFENLPLLENDTSIPEAIFYLPKKLLIFDHFEQSLTFVAYQKNTLEELVKEFEQAREVEDASSYELKQKPDHLSASENSKIFLKNFGVAKEKIKAGEIFQVVLSQIFEQKTDLNPFDLYRNLRLKNPSPYMYYLKYPDFSIIGASPETLVKVQDEQVFLRPIAGTRKRGENSKQDKEMEEELLKDPKESAEHMMLLDLARNDLGRVCQPSSIEVIKLMEVTKYSQVMHLVSEVVGKKLKQKSLFDIFKAAFPAGTLTGAPKVRAMEIIAKLEARPRGIYGGAVGYFDLSGNMDFAIAIRTMLYKKGKVRVQAGAGIVYDSVEKLENLECYNKAKSTLQAI